MVGRETEAPSLGPDIGRDHRRPHLPRARARPIPGRCLRCHAPNAVAQAGTALRSVEICRAAACFCTIEPRNKWHLGCAKVDPENSRHVQTAGAKALSALVGPPTLRRAVWSTHDEICQHGGLLSCLVKIAPQNPDAYWIHIAANASTHGHTAPWQFQMQMAALVGEQHQVVGSTVNFSSDGSD